MLEVLLCLNRDYEIVTIVVIVLFDSLFLVFGCLSLLHAGVSPWVAVPTFAVIVFGLFFGLCSYFWALRLLDEIMRTP